MQKYAGKLDKFFCMLCGFMMLLFAKYFHGIAILRRVGVEFSGGGPMSQNSTAQGNFFVATIFVGKSYLEGVSVTFSFFYYKGVLDFLQLFKHNCQGLILHRALRGMQPWRMAYCLPWQKCQACGTKCHGLPRTSRLWHYVLGVTEELPGLWY